MILSSRTLSTVNCELFLPATRLRSSLVGTRRIGWLPPVLQSKSLYGTEVLVDFCSAQKGLAPKRSLRPFD
ncbi:hypothetical protein LSTR_LSTR008394 [Laodelphax striatellus]|uniref:Uncharacterized protein n=1 Tax=Laodelphax striatellus TaxID=195883 RepID=A0A482XKN7_LAOST|nr:hypothetical protein LSTR_LSTR014442 [Laodelphax striatellus]RZF49108.1 hypothetical protein LSTR_LSTR008394 [Laodelphax striatellus]